jgi:hypothetical protein
LGGHSDVIESDQLTHHQRTLRLWEAMGTEATGTNYTGDERRRRVRLLTSESACRLERLGRGARDALPVTIRDVCLNGACLLSDVAVAVNEAIRLHPTEAVSGPPDPVEGLVVSCRWRSGRYRVGVRFQR